MKQTTRFNITITALTIILILSIGLLVRVYRASPGQKDTASDTTTTSTTTSMQTTTTTTSQTTTTTKTQVSTTTTTQTSRPEITTAETMPPPVSVEAKSIYIRADVAASSTVIDSIIAASKETELNAVVIDIKEGGVVLYDSYVPEVRDNGLYSAVFDPASVVKKLQDNGIYVIARIVCFKDNSYAKKFPDRAIKTPAGAIAVSDKSAWANPYIEANWDYNIDIAKEAASFGFNEIQYDYVRFPSAGKNSVDYGEDDLPEYSRAMAIAAFLEKSYQELKPLGVNISADVFAIACISDLDARIIGQRVDWISKYVDYVCPMIYPSHFANSSTGIMGNGVGQNINGVHFEKPDLYPYEVVYNTLVAMQKMLEGKEGIIAKVRPYIQDFTATYLRDGYYQKYTGEQVRAQIKGIYDAGHSEWILWNSGSGKITDGAFLAK
jgi:hypothetical protein